MNQNQSSDPGALPDLPAVNERVAAAVHSHRVRIRVLTTVSFLFGFLAVAASVFVVWCYLIFYLPKQKALLRAAEVAVEEARTNPAAGEASIQDAVKRIDRFLGAEIHLTHVASMGTTAVASVVGILGLGTLVLLTVVVLGRRATLNQINANLSQISNQLKELHSQRPHG